MTAPYPKQFAIYWVNLDPTIGREVQKTRPCVIISPNSMNQRLHTAIIAPMTTTQKKWPFRIPLTHKGKKGYVMLDQMRSVSKLRLHKADGTVSSKVKNTISQCLMEIFTL